MYEFIRTNPGGRCSNQQCLALFSDKVDVTKPLTKPKRRGKSNPEMHPDLRTHLYRLSGVDFTQIDGFDSIDLTVRVGIRSISFPTVKHFTSWLGLCPGSRVTGGS